MLTLFLYSAIIALFIGGYIFANIIPDKMADASAFLSFFYGGIIIFGVPVTPKTKF